MRDALLFFLKITLTSYLIIQSLFTSILEAHSTTNQHINCRQLRFSALHCERLNLSAHECGYDPPPNTMCRRWCSSVVDANKLRFRSLQRIEVPNHIPESWRFQMPQALDLAGMELKVEKYA